MYRRDLRDTDLDPFLEALAVTDQVVQMRPEPGGDRLAFLATREDRTDLWLLDDTPCRLTAGGVVGQRYNRLDPQWFDWQPDGAAVAYSSADAGLRAVDVATGEVTVVTDDDHMDVHPRYAPDGDELAFVTDRWSPGSLGIVSPDGRRFECLRDDEFCYADPRWGDDGLYVTRSRHRDFADREAEIVRVDRDGALDVIAGGDGVRAFGARPRPGTGEVAFTHDADGFDAVAIETADGRVEELFAVEGAEVAAHDWNAAGDRLAVTVTRKGDVRVWTVTRDGDAERVSAVPGQRYAPVWQGDRVLSVRSTPTEPPAVVDETANDGAGETLTAHAPVGFETRLVQPEGFTYESEDGLAVHALAFLPVGIEDADPDSVPLLVRAHGGPTAYDGYGFNFRAQYFAALGYAVVTPNYRGSDGYGREFRDRNDHAWGEGDLADVVAVADAAAVGYPAIDGDRAGIYGGSGGGLMTVNALARYDRFLAGAAFYGVYDYEAFVDDTDDVGWRLLKRELGFPATDVENYRDASPIRYVEDVDAPLLVLHGEDDRRVPISQSEALVEALEAHGKTHEFQRYEDEPHGFTRRETVVDAYTRVADLFAKYLLVDPDDGSSRPHSQA